MSAVTSEVPIYIYALCDKGGVYYVGKTRNIKMRKHWGYHSNPAVDERIAEGFTESIVVEITEAISWVRCEQYWIAFYLLRNFQLLNRTAGGEGCRMHTPEMIQMLRERSTGRILSEETKRKIGQASHKYHLGKKWSPEHRRKISLALKGKKKKPFSPTHLLNLSLSHQGQTVSAQRRLQVSLRHKGKTVSQETSRKLSDLAKQRWANPDFKAKTSQAMRGK